jgi:hypothetical protein
LIQTIWWRPRRGLCRSETPLPSTRRLEICNSGVADVHETNKEHAAISGNKYASYIGK